jgi:hypothetical protein
MRLEIIKEILRVAQAQRIARRPRLYLPVHEIYLSAYLDLSQTHQSG